MNENKLKQLFAAARKETAPAASTDFAGDILRAIHREPQSPQMEPLSVWDYLNGLFPRVAAVAVAVIILCAVADWGLTESGIPGVSDGAAQVTSQYLFNASPEDL